MRHDDGVARFAGFMSEKLKTLGRPNDGWLTEGFEFVSSANVLDAFAGRVT